MGLRLSFRSIKVNNTGGNVVIYGSFDKMNEIKAEARKQYLKYFRVWFVVGAVLLVITLVVSGTRIFADNSGVRRNNKAPAERVYDYAEVLTDEEEQSLREYIAEKEFEIQADIILVTINEAVQTSGSSWEDSMMNYADDFYDNNKYGYNKVHGNGVLLLDNYFEGQAGSWLSTCGNVFRKFGDYEIRCVEDAVYYGMEDGAYKAYMDYIDTTCYLMSVTEAVSMTMFIPCIVLATAVAALIYALVNLHQKKAKDTTTSTTYVSGGRPVINVQRDDFIRKNVVKRRIETMIMRRKLVIM